MDATSLSIALACLLAMAVAVGRVIIYMDGGYLNREAKRFAEMRGAAVTMR